METKGTVLIADRERTVRNELERLLKENGYQVMTASDSTQMYDLLDKDADEKNIDLIISDIRIPESIDDYFATHAKKRHPKLPIILTSGVADPEEGLRMVRKGAAAYFEKPWSNQEMINLVMRAMVSRRKKNITTNQVLLIDDDNISHELKERLQKKYDVHTAYTGLDALSKIMEWKLDAVILKRIKEGESLKSLAEIITKAFPYIPIIKELEESRLIEMTEEQIENRRSIISDQMHEGTPQLWGIIGPRAAGKTSTCDGVVRVLPTSYKALRYTSRAPRSGEVGGYDHIFRSPDFMLENPEKFVLTFQHKGYVVGIPKTIDDRLSEGYDVLVTLTDFDSVTKMSELYPGMRKILITSQPELLKQRTKVRDDNPETLTQAVKDYERFEKYRKEGNVDYTFKNDSPGGERYNNDMVNMWHLLMRAKKVANIIKKERYALRAE